MCVSLLPINSVHLWPTPHDTHFESEWSEEQIVT